MHIQGAYFKYEDKGWKKWLEKYTVQTVCISSSGQRLGQTFHQSKYTDGR